MHTAVDLHRATITVVCLFLLILHNLFHAVVHDLELWLSVFGGCMVIGDRFFVTVYRILQE